MYHTNPQRGIHDAVLDGGHKRARAYYEERMLLPVILSDSAFAVPSERRILISDMELVDQHRLCIR